MTQPVTVKGYRELKLIAAATGAKASRELNAELRKVAEPIKLDAENLARSTIPRIGAHWWRMRVGITRKVVYVAPRERGVRTRGQNQRRRPRFADLMQERAMEPALEQNERMINDRVETLFEHLASDWNRR